MMIMMITSPSWPVPYKVFTAGDRGIKV